MKQRRRPSRFSLKDSFAASEIILRTNVQHLKDVYITSFDAVQLFTSIPIHDTIEHITKVIRFPITLSQSLKEH